MDDLIYLEDLDEVSSPDKRARLATAACVDVELRTELNLEYSSKFGKQKNAVTQRVYRENSRWVFVRICTGKPPVKYLLTESSTGEGIAFHQIRVGLMQVA